MKHNQKGFGVLLAVVIIIAVGALGFGRWYIWSIAQKASTNTDQVPAEASNSKPAKEDGLVITEWGVRVKLGSADPGLITYVINDSDNSGTIESSAKLSLFRSATNDADCQDLGITINRRLQADAAASGKTVGEYSYDVTGSTSPCGDEILDAVRAQYTGNNPQSWEYEAVN